MRRVVLGLLVLFVLGVSIAAVATIPERRVSFHAPVFTPDGAAVIAVRRDLRLWVLGPGLEMLTPAAHVRIRRDRYRVVRLERSTGAITELEDLPPSPLEDTWTRAYRAHLSGLGQARAALSWRGGALEWSISVEARDGAGRGAVITSREVPVRWRIAGPGIGSVDERATLSNGEEVLVIPSVPCAVLLLDEAHRQVRTLNGIDGCGRERPVLDFASVQPYARRGSIERLARIEALRASLAATGRRRGLGDAEAELHAIDELERLGYFPRPPQLVATPLAAADVHERRESGTLEPLFRITEMEFRVGLFPDIEAALHSPGSEVRHEAPYLLHRDFATSQAINSFLAAGGQAFFVETAAGIHAVRVVPRREALR
jgi:hypothetical protein